MKGRIFTGANFSLFKMGTSPPAGFSFDLQRFAQTISWFYNDGSNLSSLKTGTFEEFKADVENSNYTRVQLNSNLELESDITAIADIAVAGNFTIDLKGHSITNATRNALYTYASGNLTINDISSEKTGKIASTSSSAGCVYNHGIINVNGGTITSNDNVGIYNLGSLTLNGGDISGKWGIVNFSDSEIVMNNTNINATALGIQLS